MYKPLLTVTEAARFLKISNLKLRNGIINGQFPFGTALPSTSINGEHKRLYSFHIPTKQVENYMGMKYSDFLKNKLERDENEKD